MARTRSSLVLEGVPGTPGRALASAACGLHPSQARAPVSAHSGYDP